MHIAILFRHFTTLDATASFSLQLKLYSSSFLSLVNPTTSSELDRRGSTYVWLVRAKDEGDSYCHGQMGSACCPRKKKQDEAYEDCSKYA